MNVLLPSEVARLVLGYLASTKCTGTRAKFLEECSHLREYVYLLENGQEYPTTIFGRNLVHYLNIGYQYTQYLSACGDPLKYPFGAFFSAYPNRPAGVPFGEQPPTRQESPAQPTASIRNGTPLTSPRQPSAAYRTPRSGGWPGASPAERDRRSPTDSIIDVTTVTEPPSSEPQFPASGTPSVHSSGMIVPIRPVSEASIQTEDVPPSLGQPAPNELSKDGGQLHGLPSLNVPTSNAVTNSAVLVAPVKNSCSTPIQSEQDSALYQSSGTPAAAEVGIRSNGPQGTSVGNTFTIASPTVTVTQAESDAVQITNSSHHDSLTKPFTTYSSSTNPSTVMGSDAVSPPRNDVTMSLDTSTGFQPRTSLTSLAASPKRKTIAPKKRSSLPPFDLSMGPPSPPLRDTITTSTTRRMFDEFVQNQLAEKLAESINEAAIGLTGGDNSQNELPLGGSANAVTQPASIGRSLRSFTAFDNSSCSNISATQNDLLDLAISKALADPVVEELAQYMALKTTSGGDLDTPTGTPLKGAALRTPFKQIAMEAANESIVIEDTPIKLQTTQPPARPIEKLPPLVCTPRESAPTIAPETRGVILQPGQCIQLAPGFISVTTSGTLTTLTQKPIGDLSTSAVTMSTTGAPSSTVSHSLTAPLVGDPDTMKIVVNSSPMKAPLPAPPVLRSAPRKPSPTISPPESTTFTVIDSQKEFGSEKHSQDTAAQAQVSVSNTMPLAVSTVTTNTTTTTSSAGNANASQPPKKTVTLGSHIRALDFDGLAGCARRYPNLYKNINIHESAPVSPPKSKSRPGRRKRKSPTALAKTPKLARRTPIRRSKSKNDPSNEPQKADDADGKLESAPPESKSPVTLSVFNVPTAIVSIPDEVRPPEVESSPSNATPIEDGPSTNEKSPANKKPPETRSLPESRKRRQAIMVDIAPLQRRTAPAKISSSRAKSRRITNTSKDNKLNNNNSVTALKATNNPANAANTEFIMPTTPKKYTALPANNNSNRSGDVSRVSSSLGSIKGRISIGKMQELQEEARRAAKAARETKKPSPADKTNKTVLPIEKTSTPLRNIAPKDVPSKVLVGHEKEQEMNKNIVYSTTNQPPRIAPKISPSNEKKQVVVQTTKSPNAAPTVKVSRSIPSLPQSVAGAPESGTAIPVVVRPPAVQHVVSVVGTASIAPFNLDISALLDLVHKSSPNEGKPELPPKT